MSTTVEGLSLVTVIALIRKEIAESGVEGVAGKDGKQGAKGDRGPKGDTGPQGKVGPKGGDGKQGRAGKDGKDGADGQDGADGVGIANIEQDVDNAIIVTMTDGTTYTVEMPLGQNTEVHYKVNGGGSGGGSGTVDLSNYVKRPEGAKRDGSWLVYRETADGTVKEWTPVTTDLVATNPGILFRDAKGRFKSVDVPDLKSQLEVNRWLLEQIELNTESIDNINSLGYDDTEIKSDLAKETQERKDGDARLQAEIDAIDFPDPDLDGYATEIYVDEAISSIDFPDPDLDAYATTEYVDGKVEDVEALIPSLDGYATETYVKTEIGKIDHPEYDDSGIKQDLSDETAARIAGDNTLQAEITELALALDTLLVQKTHGQWKYVGFMGDVMARNPGEFALGSDDLSASNNIIQLNNTDLNGLTVGMGDISVGDYVELVDINNPANFVLFVVAGEANGQGISEIPVTLKEKGNNFLVNATCEIRFFELNDQSIDLSELDDRYARKDHTHPEFDEIRQELAELEQDLIDIIPPPPEPPPTADGDLERAEDGELIANNIYAKPSSEVTEGTPYAYTNSAYFAWPDEIMDADFDAKRPRKLSEISHIVLQKKHRYINTQDTATKYYEQDFSETLKPGEFVRFNYTSKAYKEGDLTVPSTRVDVTFIVGDFVRSYNSQGKTFYTFEVTEVQINDGGDDAVCHWATAGSTNTLCNGRGWEEPYNHTYINTKAKDYEREYVTPEYLEECLDEERAITDSELDSLHFQVDFMAQEINHLIPIKEEGYWKVGGSSTNVGYVKFNSTAKYGPWDEGKPIDMVYFNYTGADKGNGEAPVDHRALLQGMQVGDKFECFISKGNYCLFEITRVSTQSSYAYYYVTPLKWEGEGYQMNDYLTFEFFDSQQDDGPRSQEEELIGWYGYIQGKIEDQIKIDNIHDHPGYMIFTDVNGNVIDASTNDNVKFLYFSPLDVNGNRPPIGTSKSTSYKARIRELFTRCITRKDDEYFIAPSHCFTVSDWAKPMMAGHHYNQSAERIPSIKIDPDDRWKNWDYFDQPRTNEPRYWRWPL